MIRATLRQFETFALVADVGSFARAANRLGVSSAAVSEQIRTLETRLGYALFDRRPGTSPLLNEKGLALLGKVPMLLHSASAVTALETRPESVKTIRVGVGVYILQNLILPNLAQFQQDHPNTYVEFTPLWPQEDAMRQVSAAHVDLAYLTTRAPLRCPGVECVRDVELRLVASPHHPVVCRFTAALPSRLPMVMPCAGSWMERVIARTLSAAGIGDFEVVTRAQHMDTLIHLAVIGAGVACVLEQHVAAEVERGALVALPVRLSPFYRHVFRRPGALATPQLRQFDNFALGLLR